MSDMRIDREREQIALALERATDELAKAAGSAVDNLTTTMNLARHPASCECYGCRLTRAVVGYCMAKARVTVQPQIEECRKGEQIGADVRNMVLR